MRRVVLVGARMRPTSTTSTDRVLTGRCGGGAGRGAGRGACAPRAAPGRRGCWRAGGGGGRRRGGGRWGGWADAGGGYRSSPSSWEVSPNEQKRAPALRVEGRGPAQCRGLV